MNPPPDKSKRHELSLFVVNGLTYRTNSESFLRVIYSRSFVVVAAVFLAIMLVADVSVHDHKGELLFQAVFWFGGFIAYVAIWYWQFVFLTRVKSAWLPSKMPTFVLHILPMLLLAIATKSLAEIWFGGPFQLLMPKVKDTVQVYILVLIFEFMVAKWALPYIPGIGDLLVRDDEIADDGPSKSFRIDGNNYMLSDLIFLKSAEHYVEHVSVGGTTLHRAKFRDIVDQFQPQDGVQTHRSYWVPRQSIDAVICKNKKKVMVLKNGDEIPVSRGRQDAVCNWFERNIAEQKKTGHKARPVQQGGVMP